MSLREKLLLWITLGAIGLFAADRLLLTPSLAWYDGKREQADGLERDLDQARALLDAQPVISKKWRGYRTAGLAQDASSLAAQVNASFSAWAQESGVALESVSPATRVEQEPFEEMGFVVSTRGTAGAAAAFLARLESSPIPLRVQRIDFASNDAEQDRVQLQVVVSTLRLQQSSSPAQGAESSAPSLAWRPAP
ncbi:MAG: hypothetical protein AAGA57_06575 [Planctomycetota bacterium]